MATFFGMSPAVSWILTALKGQWFIMGRFRSNRLRRSLLNSPLIVAVVCLLSLFVPASSERVASGEGQSVSSNFFVG